MTEQACPGSGRRTQHGMGRRICPVCHLTVSKVGQRPVKITPEHVRRER